MKASPESMAQGIPAMGDTVKLVTWGSTACAVITVAAGADLGPVLAQLPGGACDVPHWGYVRNGCLNVKAADGSVESVDAGELYHMPAGHSRVWVDVDTSFVEFSPAAEFNAVMQAIGKIVAG